MDIDWFMYIKENIVGLIFAFLSIQFLIFLVIREFTLWYFKINRMESLLESIDSKLGEIISNKTQEKSPIIGPMAENIEPEACTTRYGSSYETKHDELENKQNIGTPEAEVSKQDETESFLKKASNVLTKKYYISDLVTTNKKNKN